MLEEYYEFRGWDKQGAPTAARLKMLGLETLPNLNLPAQETTRTKISRHNRNERVLAGGVR
jgi:hypothetical protein